MLVSGACQTFCQGYKRLLRKSRENTPIFQVSKVPKVSQQRSCARSSSPCLSPACSPPRCLPNSEKRVAGSFFFFSLLLFFCFFSCLLFWSPPPWPVFNPTPWFLFLFHLTDERTCFLFLQKKEKEHEELQKGEHKMITVNRTVTVKSDSFLRACSSLFLYPLKWNQNFAYNWLCPQSVGIRIWFKKRSYRFRSYSYLT